VDGCKNWLQSRGVYPQKITTYYGMVQDVLEKHADASVVVLTVDNSEAKYFVNQFCAIYGIPLIVGGIYPLGDGGEVITLTDLKDTCLRCVEHQLGRDLYLGKVVDYGLGTEQLIQKGDLKAVPALRGPVSEIAAVIAEVVLDIVHGKKVENKIYLRARNWTPVVNIFEKQYLKILAEYINIQDSIGLVNTMRLSKVDGVFQFEIRNSSFNLMVSRWDRCPEHSRKQFSIDDI
jgi:hypothetical protein